VGLVGGGKQIVDNSFCANYVTNECTCPANYVQEGNVCIPVCYYSTPKCLLASFVLSCQPSTTQQGIICTMDAKQCPDGSYVGRVPPNCDFAPCP